MTTPAPLTFVFGDSLSDSNNAFNGFIAFLTPQIFQQLVADGIDPAIAAVQAPILAEQQARAEVPAFGPQGAITNEFTYVDYAAQLGAITPVNLSTASARATGVQEPFGPGTGDINLGGQLGLFAAATAGGVPPGSSAIVNIGANDLSDAFSAAASGSFFQGLFDVLDAIGDISGTVTDAVAEIADAGIETIYVPTLPLPSFFVGTDALDSDDAAFAELASGIYNGALTLQVAGLQLQGIDARIIDFAAVASAITEDPSGFGIVAPRSDLLIDGSPFDSDQVLAWDPIHPTEVAHQAWGAYLDFTLAGGTTSALSDFGTLNIQGSGDNAVFAMGGNDVVFAGAGEDVVFGGTGNDTIFAGRHADIVSGGAGDDTVNGQGGDDILDGGDGDDAIWGGGGADILLDGLGNDIVRGGGGDDTFIYVQGSLEGDASATEDRFSGGRGDDTLLLVLDDASFDTFQFASTETVLDAFDITARGIETVEVLNGRGAVEDALGGSDSFALGDFWGLLPAPTEDLLG